MEEKLNVVPDELAGDYQDQLGLYRPTTHVYPSAPAVLEINGMPITSNVRHQLIKAYTEPRYICNTSRAKISGPIRQYNQ